MHAEWGENWTKQEKIKRTMSVNVWRHGRGRSRSVLAGYIRELVQIMDKSCSKTDHLSHTRVSGEISTKRNIAPKSFSVCN